MVLQGTTRTATQRALCIIGCVAVCLAHGLAACGYDAGPLDAATAGDVIPVADGRGSGDAPSGPSACDNGVDDDCDGLVDFGGGDPGCASSSDGNERGPGAACDDGIDNDNDGVRDYVVAGCGTTPGDPGCSSPTDVTELNAGPL